MGADFGMDHIGIWIIKAVFILVFLLTSVLFAIWFERRVVARLQLRPGPNVHGPFGLLQSLGDAMKLLLKEDMTVTKSDKFVYLLAPVIAVFASLLTFAVIPFGPEARIPFTDIITPLQLTDFPVAVLYILACASIGVYGIVLGGWSSGSTYPLLGGVRSTAQVISYELAMGLALVSVLIVAGGMSTSQIVNSQQTVWWALPLLPAFIIYVISMIGETNRLPFDLPEAEGELVAGYTTEYSSMKFAWFFLAEYINMLNVSAVCVTLFLGGWRAPWPLSTINDGMLNEGWWPVLWFVTKVWMVMFVFVWVRGTLLRYRYDQFMRLGWKVLIPGALVWVVAVAAFKGFSEFADVPVAWLLLAGGVLVLLGILFVVVRGRRAKAFAAANAPQLPEVLDAFENGYPVPPRPGQSLPQSTRQRSSTGAVAAQLEAEPELDPKEPSDD